MLFATLVAFCAVTSILFVPVVRSIADDVIEMCVDRSVPFSPLFHRMFTLCDEDVSLIISISISYRSMVAAT